MKSAVPVVPVNVCRSSDTAYCAIITKRMANPNENFPMKTKFVTTRHTCHSSRTRVHDSAIDRGSTKFR